MIAVMSCMMYIMHISKSQKVPYVTLELKINKVRLYRTKIMYV